MPIPRKCPKCGGKMYVNYSDPKKDGLDQLGAKEKVIRRRLECDDCGEKITTYEITAKDLHVIKDTKHELARKNRKMRTVLGQYERAMKRCSDALRDIYDN